MAPSPTRPWQVYNIQPMSESLKPDPILLEIPDQFESQRLLIRVPRAGDGPAVNAAVIDSLETLRPWMPWAQAAPSLEESEAVCRTNWAKFLLRQDITLRLYLKGTDTVIGSSGLHRIDWSIPSFEIGYWVGRRYEGQGYATEAVRAISGFAIRRLAARRLEIRADARNARSRRVAERAGFGLEGIHRCFGRDVSGELCDMCIYARIIQDSVREA